MSVAEAPNPTADAGDLLLTRREASAYLLTQGIRLKPSTLARLWCTGGDGPPCVHIRRKPHYPQAVLREWAARQKTGLRTSSDDPPPAHSDIEGSP